MLRVMAGCDAHVSCLVGDNGYFRVGKLMIGDCRSSMSCDWRAVLSPSVVARVLSSGELLLMALTNILNISSLDSRLVFCSSLLSIAP